MLLSKFPRVIRKLNRPESVLEINRNFASQTLLSRSDFEKKTMSELREEIRTRGLVISSKKKSVLISTILEDDVRKRSNEKFRETQTRPITTSKNVKPSTDLPGVNSSEHLATRIVAQVETNAPPTPKIDTGSSSSSLASPVTNSKSQGHHSIVWPASVTLPITPEEESVGTAIPFIPDNYNSHLQSHAPELSEIKASSAGLEVSTASHPSTLPGGGPSLAATDDLKSSSAVPSESCQAAQPQDLFSGLTFVWSNPPNLASLIPVNNHETFEPEDRPLTQDEINGLMKLIGILSGGWILSGLFSN